MLGILLDLDNTLIDDRLATKEGFRKFYSVYKPGFRSADFDVEQNKWQDCLERNWKRYESGKISFQEQRRNRIRDYLERDLNDKEADGAFEVYRTGYESSWQLLPGVTEFLDKTANLPKVIVTNGDREAQLRKIRTTGLDLYIANVITPADCGCWKPEPGIFMAALNLLGLSAPDVLMLGDDFAKDIEPARHLGMQCFLVKPGVTILDTIGRT